MKTYVDHEVHEYVKELTGCDWRGDRRFKDVAGIAFIIAFGSMILCSIFDSIISAVEVDYDSPAHDYLAIGCLVLLALLLIWIGLTFIWTHIISTDKLRILSEDKVRHDRVTEIIKFAPKPEYADLRQVDAVWVKLAADGCLTKEEMEHMESARHRCTLSVGDAFKKYVDVVSECLKAHTGKGCPRKLYRLVEPLDKIGREVQEARIRAAGGGSSVYYGHVYDDDDDYGRDYEYEGESDYLYERNNFDDNVTSWMVMHGDNPFDIEERMDVYSDPLGYLYGDGDSDGGDD